MATLQPLKDALWTDYYTRHYSPQQEETQVSHIDQDAFPLIAFYISKKLPTDLVMCMQITKH